MCIPSFSCIAHGDPIVQDKSIEILSKLCKDQPILLGDEVANTSGCVSSIAKRVIESSLLHIRLGGAALLICAAKEHNQSTLEIIMKPDLCSNLIHSLVKMIDCNDLSGSSDTDHIGDLIIYNDPIENPRNREVECLKSVILSGAASVWLLSVLASHDDKNKVSIMDARAIEALNKKISSHILQVAQVY